MKTVNKLWDWVNTHGSEAGWALFWALIVAAAFDLASVDSRIRAGIRHLKNVIAEVSVKRLRKRIAQLETYRNLVISSTDKVIYLGALMAILVVLIFMCIAGAVALSDNLGFLQGGKVLACFILSLTVGVGLATLRFHALDTDPKEKIQKLITKFDKDIAHLQKKLEKRIG